METLSTLLAICAGNSPVPGEFPTQKSVTWALVFSLICAQISGWVNNDDAGDMRRHRSHYDVIVMMMVVRMKPPLLQHAPGLNELILLCLEIK